MLIEILLVVLIVLVLATFLRCRHTWGPISLVDNPEGYQYCSKCGMARVAEHEHVWEVYKQYEIDRASGSYRRTVGDMIINRCKVCGKIEHNEIKIGGN